MNVRIDTFAYTNRLRKLPANEKLIFASVVEGVAIFGGVTVQVAIILWMGLWAIAHARIPAGFYLRLLGFTSLFLLSGLPALAINIVWLHDANGAIDAVSSDFWGGLKLGAWYVYLSRQGTFEAVEVATRSLACVSCLFFLLLTTPFIELLQLFRRLGMPEILTELMLLMYRFLFILWQTAYDLKVAQQARGGDRTWGRKMSGISLLVGQLFKRTLKRYRQFTLGVAARGFTGEFKVLSGPKTRGDRSLQLRYEIEAIIGCGGLLALEWWRQTV